MPNGVNTPWLIALLRNKIFAGSTTIETNGSMPALTIAPTAPPKPPVKLVTNGPTNVYATHASKPPSMPAEKLLTNISKPPGIES